MSLRRSEGQATLTNTAIRDELKAATGIDIGISGEGTKTPFGNIARGAGTTTEKQETIGDLYGRELRPSTNPTEGYRSNYSDFYREQYRTHFSPGAPGNLR